MSDTPRFLCPGCNRPVLNSRFARCLYCGAALPPEAVQPPPAPPPEEERQQRRDEASDGLSDVIGDLLDSLPDLGDLFD